MKPQKNHRIRKSVAAVLTLVALFVFVAAAAGPKSRSNSSPSLSIGKATTPTKITPKTVSGTPVLDHFKAYITTGPANGDTVQLLDQFDNGVPQTKTVGQPFRFANPVQKTHHGVITPITNPDTHLKMYQILPPEPSPRPERNVQVNNQFGPQTLTVYDPVLLGVPTQKNGIGSIHDLDHFKFYKAVGGPVAATVDLLDQFHQEPGVRVLQPRYFGIPVRKTHNAVVTPITRPNDLLVCYDIVPQPFNTNITTLNQFGPETLVIQPADLLCVPSRKPTPGSIYVLKLDDRGDDPLPDWRMNLHAGSGCSGPVLQSGFTNNYGMVDFEGLSDGSYSVAEVPQPGWAPVGGVCQDVNVTSNPPSRSGPGLDYPGMGNDSFPSGAHVTIDITGFGTDHVTLMGPTTISRSAPCLGCGPGGRTVIQTEMLQLDLQGVSPMIGPVFVQESPSLPSQGRVMQQTPGVDYPAESFFDIFFQIQTQVGVLHNNQPLRMQSVIYGIPPISSLYFPPFPSTPIQLFNNLNQPVGFLRHAAHVPVTPQEIFIVFRNHPPPPPTPTSVVSRKTHGGAGNFGINLPLTGTAGVECRSGGANGDHTVVVTFANPVSVTGNPQAHVTLGSGTMGSGGASNGGAVTVAGAVVTMPLTNVTNAQTINVTLHGVNNGSGYGNVIIPMSVLLGDTGGNGSVGSTDISQTRLQSGMVASGSNFRTDVTVSGTINATDVSAVRLQSGTGLPP